MARVVYNENYVAMPMRHALDLEHHSLRRDATVEYGWRHRGEWNHLRVRTEGDREDLSAGSEAEFITEHYWGYAAQRDGGCVEYQVEHPPWRVWQARESELHCNVAGLYCGPFVEPLTGKANSAFVAEGSRIVVRRGARL